MAFPVEYSAIVGLIESTRSPIYSVDRKFRYTGFNKAHIQAMKTLYGAQVGLGGKILDLITIESDRVEIRRILDRALHGEYHNAEIAVGGDTGPRTRYRVMANPIRDSKESVTGVFVLAADIPPVKRGQDPMGEIEEKVNTLFRATPVGIGVAKERTFIELNARLCEMTGYGRDELVGKNTRILYPAQEDFDLVGRDLYGQMAEKGSGTVETRWQRKDGAIIDVLLSSVPLEASDHSAGVAKSALDITSRKLAEKALRESEKNYKSVFDNIQDVFYRSGKDGHLILGSPSGVKLFGYASVEEMLGKHLDSFWVDPTRREALLAKIRESGSVNDFEGVLQRKDGSTFNASISAHFHYDENGAFQGTEGIIRDVTERKRSEEERRESEASLKISQQVAHVGHWTWDTCTNKVVWSDEMYQIFGINQGNFSGDLDTVVATAVHPEDREKVKKANAAVIHDQQAVPMEYRVIWPDQSVHTVWAIPSRNTVDAEGRILKLSGIVQDITDRKRVEEALRESEERYRAIVNAVPDLLFRIRGDGLILDYSAPDGAHLFAPPETFLARNIKDVLPPEVSAPSATAIEQALLSREMVTYEYALPLDGEKRFYECRVVPLSKEEVLALIRDITLRKLSDEHLKSSLQEKELLLREIHHRVKNNLQIIASMLHMQTDEPTDKQVLARFREAQDRVRSIALVHENLYRSSNLAQINFSEYLQDVAAGLFRVYSNSAAKLKIDCEDVSMGIDVAIPCGLIINELVSNALKYAFPDGRAGLITITLKAEPPDHVVLSIQDNGVGMPEDVDFLHGDTLGMTLVGILVEQINGTARLDRKTGTNFTIKFKRSLE